MLRRILTAIVALTLATPQAFAGAGVRTALLNTVPSFVVGRGSIPSTITLNCATNQGYQQGKIGGVASFLTTTRATTGHTNDYADDLSGTWLPFIANTLRQTSKGCRIEEARTNNALWSRDMTNAAWVKVSVTTALNAVGIDGTANSATTVTATGALATIAQVITLASAADNYSVWLKCITCTGNINISINNFVGTTTCTVSTAAFSRCTVSNTLANPTIGIQIANNGDSIIADFNQLEAGTFPTSPILTTTAAINRSADVVVTTSTPVFGSAFSLFAQGTPEAPTAFATNQIAAVITDGSGANRLSIIRNASDGSANAFNNSGGVGNTLTTTTWAQSTSGKFAVATAASDQAATFNGGTIATGTGAVPAGMNSIHMGSSQSNTAQYNGNLEDIAVWASARVPNGLLRGFPK